MISPLPIKLSIGTIVKPKLREIAEISFEKFYYFEGLTKLTYDEYMGDETLSNDEFAEVKENDKSIFSIIITNNDLKNSYLEMLNFFFVEKIEFIDGVFVILNVNKNIPDNTFKQGDIRGIIFEDNFSQIMEIIQQVCCIYDSEENPDESKFKNKNAKKLFQMIKTEREKAKKNNKKADSNLSLPNLISAVSNKHNSINPINVWDLTIYQLLDSFNRLQGNSIYDMNCRQVSVWGDKDNKFDVALWYKNNYDNN